MCMYILFICLAGNDAEVYIHKKRRPCHISYQACDSLKSITEKSAHRAQLQH